MLTKIAYLLFLLFNGVSVLGQIDTILWQNCLGTENGKNWTLAAEKSAEGYLFGINLDENGPGVNGYHGNGDAWIVNTDKHGNVLWEWCYGGSNGDGSHKIIQIDDNNYFLLNSSVSHDGDLQNERDGNFWVVKIDPEGNIIWENSYGGTTNGEGPIDAILMPDNGLLMMGRISSAGGDVTEWYGDMDVWLCRIDSVGNILWQKTIGNFGKDNGLKVKLTSHNTILFIGGHEVTGGMISCPDLGYYIDTDVWIVEMDLKGEVLNQWCYGGKYYDLGYDIIEIDDGYVIASSTRSNDRDVHGFHGIPNEDASADIWSFKIDFEGNLIWQKCLGGYSWENPIYLTKTGDGGFIIIGNTNSYDGDVTGNHSPDWNELDIWVVKLSGDGQLLWEHCFGSSASDRFWGINSVLKKDDYNYIIGANSQWANGDVTCNLFPYDNSYDAWLIEIKDCSYYLPLPPPIPSGPDTLCTISNPISSYSIDTVQWATGFNWKIEPESAGTIVSDSVTSQVTWNPLFEGQVTVQARSFNDCGYSEWSEPRITQVYTCMGVEESDRTNWLTVWPNPTSEMINVIYKKPGIGMNCKLSVLDIFGRTISIPDTKVIIENEKSWKLTTSTLPCGIYFIVLKEADAVKISSKFIVVR